MILNITHDNHEPGGRKPSGSTRLNLEPWLIHTDQATKTVNLVLVASLAKSLFVNTSSRVLTP